MRLWRRTKVDDPSTDVTIFTWGISFTGLVYMGPKLSSNNLESMLHNNSLIFHLHGGFFVPSYCLNNSPQFRRYLYMSVSNSEICQSYTVEQLIKLRNQMKYMKEISDNVQILKDKIATGENNEKIKNYKQTKLNKLLLQPKIINKEKKIEILNIKKQLEIEKFRKKLLEQERIRKVSDIRKLNKLHLSMMEDNQDKGLLLMERYRELNKDIERLREWRQNHIETREIYLQKTAQLSYRRRKLMSDLSLIYEIKYNNDNKLTINNVHLPDSEELNIYKNDLNISVGLGYVVQTIDVVSKLLNIPTRYPIINNGSRCKIIDHISNDIRDKDRQFSLFSRNKDKLKFHYGVYLLNKNISQLRWYCGLPTIDLRCTLLNLSTLLNFKNNNHQVFDNTKRTLSGSSLNMEQNELPSTPPLQKLLFDKMNMNNNNNINRQMFSIKNYNRKILSSSLDQGLDKSLTFHKFNNTTKRICKSYDFSIDNNNKLLSLPRDVISSSSDDENINIHIFNKNINIDKSLSTTSSSELLNTEIEISIPLSITKIHSDDSTLKKTSSTSISSCEIALNSSSQNDCVDMIVNNNNIEIKIDEESSCGDGSPSTISIINKINYNISQETINDNNNTTTNLANKITINNSNSFASLNDINHTDNITDDEHVVASSCPESAKSFYDDYDDNNSTINKCKYESTINLQTTSVINNVNLTNLQTNKVEQVINNYQASSELIDSIRKSSENVFARTEALASKKTSFKVMKPRL